MAKFNTINKRGPRGPVEIDRAAGALVTHEGAPALARTVKSDLFMLGVTNMVGEDTFYEKGTDRDARFVRLVREVAVADVAWLAGFVRWLRTVANLRSAPIVAAAEGVHARRAAGLAGGNRALVDAAVLRADEPGEFLAYWRSRFGRQLPGPVKNGLTDAVRRVYTEFATLKYDTPTAGYRFGDVVETVHPKPRTPGEAELFEHLLARRHGRAELFRGGGLPMLRARAVLAAMPAGERRARLGDWALFRGAGMTWEAVPAWLDASGDGRMDATAWEAIIPHMGLFALARNLRNFDEAGVSDEVAARIVARFSDPGQVARSRMFPYRWLAAYEAAPSLRWSHGLDLALNASVRDVPALTGRTLVLVDTSASMTRRPYAARSKMTPAKNAAIFGAVLALRNPAATDLVGFATGSFRHHARSGEALLRVVEAFNRRNGEVGHGTEIAAALQANYAGHARVFVISDMQTMDTGVSSAVPERVPMYGVNLGGFRPTVIPAGDQRRFEFPALGDAMFAMVPLLESGQSAGWPWE
jgi:hypothetical protein